MKQLSQSKYKAVVAQTRDEIRASQYLRHLCFGGSGHDVDSDQFDDDCSHILIHDVDNADLVCCFRIMHLTSAQDIGRTYSAQFYNLTNLKNREGSVLEIGRFCIHPDASDPDILRTAWSVLTRFVDDHQIEFMFGCSSFQGTDRSPYEQAFALLKERHLAPDRWTPSVKSPQVYQFAAHLSQIKPNVRMANQTLPPLLRTYLTMGGWVSDHAVIDNELNTMHVFTGLEISAIPESRKRLLRAIA
jgi:putative hemolysin